MKSKNLALNYDNKYLFFNTFIFLLIIVIDRVTKNLALCNYFSLLNSKFFIFDLTINRGVSCGIFHCDDSKVFFFVSLSVLLIIFFLLFHIKLKIQNGEKIIAEILILSGAISNFIDRIFHKGVIDFIALCFGNMEFPVFNIADTSIVIGTLILLYETI